MKLKKQRLIVIILAGCVVFAALGTGCKPGPKKDYPVTPVSFTDVQIMDSFWLPRMVVNRKITIPYAFEQCEETGRIKNFEVAGKLEEGKFSTVYPFDDSDVYKTIEGASYSLSLEPDPELDKYLDDLIAKIAAAQEEDGYLYTARTIDPQSPPEMAGPERWVNLQWSHELYNLGHLYEAAVAHYQATGKRTLLDIALKSADFIDTVFGRGKRRDVPGHEEIELGLVKLYRVTGEKKYLNLAKFFIDERGNAKGHKPYGEYAQDHIPVVEQEKPVGHAVRAVYLYSGMADVAALTGDKDYLLALDRIWENVVSKKLYITGGIGSTSSGEAFGDDYQLPNETAYCETCAAIGNAFWNQRMFLLKGDSKYIDVLERILYNGSISGIDLSGEKFFYPNPLESFGQHSRSTWFTCACCPPNVTRFVSSFPGYVYAIQNDNLYVNLFVASKAEVGLADAAVTIVQRTGYPWMGTVDFDLFLEQEKEFAVHLRIPGWARNQPVPSDLYRYLDTNEEEVVISVNGEKAAYELENGYAVLRRVWKANDTIELALPMPVRRVVANENVEADRGRVALQRGPVVFCAEWPDNEGHVSNLYLPDDANLTWQYGSWEYQPGLFHGMVSLKGRAVALSAAREGEPVVSKEQGFLAVPYYSWAHRGVGEMTVWIPREASQTRPLPLPTIASEAIVTASGGRNPMAINDLREPSNSNDHSVPYFHWWPRKGTQEWVEYDFGQTKTVSQIKVYWFDDTGRGECRVPASWRVLYKEGGEWKPLAVSGEYGVAKDQYNTVDFRPFRTSGLRLEVELQEKFSAGIHEWVVD